MDEIELKPDLSTLHYSTELSENANSSLIKPYFIKQEIMDKPINDHSNILIESPVKTYASENKCFGYSTHLRDHENKCDLKKHIRYAQEGIKNSDSISENSKVPKDEIDPLMIKDSDFIQENSDIFSEKKSHIRYVHVYEHFSSTHICVKCGKTFKTPSKLKNHISSVHEKMKNHKCEKCDKTFVQKESLYRHINTYHENADTCSKCEKCGKYFSTIKILQKHIGTVHEGVKNYKCEACGKAYFLAKDLKRHNSTVHEGVKNHKCESCGKSYKSAGNLKTHISMFHEEVKNLEAQFLKQT